MAKSDLSVNEKVNLLLDAMEKDKRINEVLSGCKDSEAMLSVLVEFSSRLGLDLTREDFTRTPPIRDWIWWKNKEALVTLGSGTPRYQQDKTLKTSKLNKFLARFFS